MSSSSLFCTVGFMRFISILSLSVAELTPLRAQSSSALWFLLFLLITNYYAHVLLYTVYKFQNTTTYIKNWYFMYFNQRLKLS